MGFDRRFKRVVATNKYLLRPFLLLVVLLGCFRSVPLSHNMCNLAPTVKFVFLNRATLDASSLILRVLHVCEEHVQSHVALLADNFWWLLFLARTVVRA